MPAFDLHTAACILGIALAGGIIGLDRTAVGQFMISQPIVAGPLAGWLLGDTAAGMAIGAVLELVWLLDMPVGTFVPADATIGAIAATTIAALGSGEKASPDLVGFSVVLTTAMVPITMMADTFIRKRNSALAEEALSYPGQDAGCRLGRAHLSGLLPFFLKSFVLYLFFIPAGLLAVVVFVHLPPQAHAGMELLMKVLPLLGAALILRKLSVGNVYLFFMVGFAAAAVIAVLVQDKPLIVILLVTAAGFLASRYVSDGLKARSTSERT